MASVFFTLTAGSVSSGHFLASTVSPLSAPGTLVIHTPGPSVCFCVSSTLPPSSIGQPECSLQIYSPVHEFSFLLRLTCCQACLQILHFCHYAFHLQHILRLFSQDVSSLVKFFLFVCVNVTRSVDITLQSSCGNFKIEGISGSASKSYLLVACSLISRPCVSFKGLCFLLDEKLTMKILYLKMMLLS